jgi:hypothetical protein
VKLPRVGSLRVRPLLVLYPGWWRDRYGDEMRALLDEVPPRPRDGLDLARGALDAWLHPPVPSHVPGVAAVTGGGAWTAVTLGVLFEPVPPDWPGYLHDSLALAIVAAGSLLVATVCLGGRAADAAGRAAGMAATLAAIGYLAWIGALVATAGGAADTVTLAVGQTLAMVGSAAVGLVLVRIGEEVIGFLVVLAAAAMLIPWTPAWLAFGACWTVIGVVLEFERADRAGEGLRTP